MLEVLPSFSDELKVKIAVLARRPVKNSSDIKRNCGEIQRDSLAAEHDLADLAAIVRNTTPEVENSVAHHVPADPVRLVASKPNRENRVFRRIRVKGEKDMSRYVCRRRDAIVDRHRKAHPWVASVILLDLERPVPLALAADADVGGINRRGDLYRNAAEIGESGLNALEFAGRHRLCPRIRLEVEGAEATVRPSKVVVANDGVLDASRRTEEERFRGRCAARAGILRVLGRSHCARAVEKDIPPAVRKLLEDKRKDMARRRRNPVPLAKDVKSRRDHSALASLGVLAERTLCRTDPLLADRRALKRQPSVDMLRVKVLHQAGPHHLLAVCADIADLNRPVRHAVEREPHSGASPIECDRLAAFRRNSSVKGLRKRAEIGEMPHDRIVEDGRVWRRHAEIRHRKPLFRRAAEIYGRDLERKGALGNALHLMAAVFGVEHLNLLDSDLECKITPAALDEILSRASKRIARNAHCLATPVRTDEDEIKPRRNARLRHRLCIAVDLRVRTLEVEAHLEIEPAVLRCGDRLRERVERTRRLAVKLSVRRPYAVNTDLEPVVARHARGEIGIVHEVLFKEDFAMRCGRERGAQASQRKCVLHVDMYGNLAHSGTT